MECSSKARATLSLLSLALVLFAALMYYATDMKNLAIHATLYSPQSSDLGRLRRYATSPADIVLASAVPTHIPAALLSLEWVDVVGPNGTLRRCRPADLPFAMLYNVSRPAAFLINLDRRTDRLRESIAEWADLVQLIRVSAQPHARPGGVYLNGCALTHLSIILAMQVSKVIPVQPPHACCASHVSPEQTHGWPFVLVLEDDAEKTPLWKSLLPGIISAVAGRGGDVGEGSMRVIRLLRHPGPLTAFSGSCRLG